MKIIFRFFATVLLVPVFWITATAQNVSGVTVTQVGKTVEVAYNLDKAADITLHLSTDGGVTYRQLHQVTGDVGKTIGPGHNTIVWDVMAETGELMGDDIVFKVKVEANAEAAWRKKQKKEEEEAKAREIALAKEAKEKEIALAKEMKEKEKEAEKTKKALEKEAKANEIIYAQEAKAKELALAKEAREREKEAKAKELALAKETKEKEKALERETRATELAIKKEDRKIRLHNMPYSTFFTLNTAFSFNTYPAFDMPYSLWSYGFKVGQMKIVGWYAGVMTNFRFKGWENPFEDGHYWLTDRKPIRFSAQTGLVIRPCRPMSMLFGVGYGYQTIVYKTIENEWFSHPGHTLHGVDVSFGFLFDIKGFALSFETVTTNFRTAELKVGLGFCLPTDKKNTKKQTVKVIKNEKL